MGQRNGLQRVPLRRQAAMHQQVVALQVCQGAKTQPIDDFAVVRGGEQGLQGIAGPHLADTRGDGKQMEVVVAEHGYGPVTHRHDIAHRFKGIRPAVDKVPAEPDRLPGRRLHLSQQLPQGTGATLQVADRDRHTPAASYS